VHEILEVFDTEIAWFYFSLLGNRPGLPIRQEQMGYNNYGLNQVLGKASKITQETWGKTVIARAAEITFSIIEGRFFQNHNIKVARAAGLHMLKKNGFTTKDDPPDLKIFTRKRIEDWFSVITIPPIDR